MINVFSKNYQSNYPKNNDKSNGGKDYIGINDTNLIPPIRKIDI